MQALYSQKVAVVSQWSFLLHKHNCYLLDLSKLRVGCKSSIQTTSLRLQSSIKLWELAFNYKKKKKNDVHISSHGKNSIRQNSPSAWNVWCMPLWGSDPRFSWLSGQVDTRQAEENLRSDILSSHTSASWVYGECWMPAVFSPGCCIAFFAPLKTNFATFTSLKKAVFILWISIIHHVSTPLESPSPSHIHSHASPHIIQLVDIGAERS